MNYERIRAVFISDVHLGSKFCKAEKLAEVLETKKFDIIYLVGDIFDTYLLSKYVYLPQEQQRVIHLLLKKARKGTKIIYLSGNHDDFVRNSDLVSHYSTGNFICANNYIHETTSGKKLLVIHGDQFDVAVKHRWFIKLCTRANEKLIFMSHMINKVRSWFKLRPTSLASFMSSKVGVTRDKMLARYKIALGRYAAYMKVDGVICGHTHVPEVSKLTGNLKDIEYYNCGDWVHNNTLLFEDSEGNIVLHTP